MANGEKAASVGLPTWISIAVLILSGANTGLIGRAAPTQDRLDQLEVRMMRIERSVDKILDTFDPSAKEVKP